MVAFFGALFPPTYRSVKQETDGASDVCGRPVFDFALIELMRSVEIVELTASTCQQCCTHGDPILESGGNEAYVSGSKRLGEQISDFSVTIGVSGE